MEIASTLDVSRKLALATKLLYSLNPKAMFIIHSVNVTAFVLSTSAIIRGEIRRDWLSPIYI